MVNIDSNKSIYLFSNDISFRLGIDGLTNLVLSKFKQSEIIGNLYIFFSKSCKQVKILEFDSKGTWLYQNKLKDYKYNPPIVEDNKIKIDRKQLKLILKNVELLEKKARK